jgi:transcription-repair coupling factor (superfamily II helicase)
VLEDALDLMIGSPAFGRLLSAGGPTLRARAGAGHDFVVASLARALDGPVLAVAPGPADAEELAEGLAGYLGPARVALFPAWEALPYEGISPGADVASRRAEAARRARAAAGPFVMVAPVAAALQGVPPDLGAEPPVVVQRGGTVDRDELLLHLDRLGYARADVVEHRGEYAVRGGIVDVFGGTARRPVRIELWGAEVESLRAFSAATQLATDPVARAELHPVRELVPTQEVRARAEHLATRHAGAIGDRLTRLADGLIFEGMEGLAGLVHDRMPLPVELLGSQAWVVLTRSRRTIDRARQALDDATALADATRWPGPPVVRPLDEMTNGRTTMHLTELAEADAEDLGLSDWGPSAGSAPQLADFLAALHRDEGYRVLLAGEGPGSVRRIQEVVADRGLTAGDDWPVAAVEALLTGGFVFEPGKLAVATEEDLFGRRRHTRSAPRIARRRADAIALELQPGDFAVHRVHGVGRYTGMVRRAIAGSERDYLLLEYAHGDKLYVPSDQVGVVARYLGGEAPRLNRLGTSDWTKQTAKVRRAVRDMAGELVRLYTARMAIPGHAFSPDTPWQHELEGAFPFEETRDQLSAIAEVKRDMEEPEPMDRLICGDVGFGKTEVAVRAAFKAVMDGKQVAVLVPTTLLAEQHFVTFSERYAPFPVKVAMLSRFVHAAEQDRTLEALARGEVDVVVGTHRLLSRDVRFKDLGLLVVDEEQRFGVGHKERMKQLRAQVDVLTMTATPIPRTMEMALAGIREMSVVETPPEDRQPVLTFVGSWDEQMALAAVRRELLRGGQVFWVHNRVQTIDRQAHWISENLPDARVVVAHGQMDEDLLEKEMMRFWDRDADVLVSTTIIESGLDVPSANTLIVERADRLGLAQMYQLRGRVGRSKESAFAYFFFPPVRKMTEEAHERLATISKHTSLGSGFHIALRDLEIRGAGNLLGAEQHGHIAAVGFDTYCRLLQEAVGEMKGEPVEPEREIRIELPVRAFLPVEWVGQEALRLEMYRKISTAADHIRLAEVRAEAEDRFGRLPSEVETLLAVSSLRITAQRLGITEVTTFRKEVRLRPLDLADRHAVDLTERVPVATWHRTTQTLNLLPEVLGGPDLPGWVERRLLETVDEAPPDADEPPGRDVAATVD